MKRKVLLLIALLLVAVPLVYGPVAAQDDVLTVWADEARAPVIEELGAAFEEEYGIAVEVVQLGFGDIRDQLITAGPAGEGADIVIGAHDWLGQLVENGLLAPIDLPEETAELFSPVALQAFNYNGELYGIPYAVENVALYRNTDLVPEAPETWDEVAEISRELQASGDAQYGFVLQNCDPYHFYGIQSAFGGYVFGLNEDGSYNPEDVGIDSEGSIEALDFISGLVAEGVVPVTTGDEASALFESGDAAMIISGPWFLERFRDDAGLPIAVSPIPAGSAGPGAPFLGAQGFMVNQFSENTDLAVAFLTEYIATEEAMAALQEAGGRPSAFVSVAETIEDTELLSFGEAGAVGNPMPAIPAMSSVWSSWTDGISLAIRGEQTAAESLATAAEQIRTAISGE